MINKNEQNKFKSKIKISRQYRILYIDNINDMYLCMCIVLCIDRCIIYK